MNRNIRIISLSLLLLMVTTLFYGCGSTSSTTGTAATSSASSEKAKTETGKKWGLDKLVLVLLPGEDTPAKAQIRSMFDKELSAELGIPVEEFHATDYTAAIEAMRTGKAQIASFGPFSYVTAVDRAGAECLVTTAKDGKHGYYSKIITKKDSPINTVADLKGKRFAFVDPESTSGNVVPSDEILTALKDSNLTFDLLHMNGKFFSSVMFAGTHPNSIQGVVKGDVDAAAVSSSTLDKEATAKHYNPDTIKAIHTSPLIPGSPIAVQKDLPKELKDKIKNYLLKYDNQEYWKMQGQTDGGPKYSYIAITNDDYKFVKDLQSKYNLKD